MNPWEELGRSAVPGGSDEMRLMRRGRDHSIILGRIELMNSRLSGSEEALATLACDRLAGRGRLEVLVGGLGMGFTLRALLARLGPDCAVDVAELVPAVVEWARGPLASLFAGSLDDPRVAVRIGDVGALMRPVRGRYDAILLDVDNGPEGFTRAGNDALYGAEGLASAHRALRHGGILAVWSTGPDERFVGRLRQAGFRVDEHRVRARAGRGARHVVWIATR